jgi:hypothetical protein
MRVFDGDLFILPTEERLPVDALPPGEAYDIDLAEASALPPWPARKFTSFWLPREGTPESTDCGPARFS